MTRGTWLPDRQLVALHDADKTLDEIAGLNEAATGWRPTRSGVLRKLQRLGAQRKYKTHALLLPWDIRPEHNSDPLRHMLQAESRWRQSGGKVSPSDERLIDLLHDQIAGRGRPMVVSYDPAIGFHLVARNDTDEDIIRQPPPATSPDQNDSDDSDAAADPSAKPALGL